MKFLDETTIIIASGHGGPGCVSFLRARFVPKGGPDGGNGGKGGDVIFVGDNQLGTLLDISYHRSYKAKSGSGGQGADMDGKGGDDVVIPVPIGTLIKEPETGDLLYEIMEDGEIYTACFGGRGGKGNTHFKSATQRTPRFAQPGESGEEKRVKLELKLIADIGIVGLPNAGKSTLISRISRAKPKIADYPFTTLVPNLGVVSYSDYKTFVVADIPGLIKGAHEGHGLGTKFLKHVERTNFLIHMLDASMATPEQLLEDYHTIKNELALYKDELSFKKELVVFNKFDTVYDRDEKIAELKELFADIESEPLFVSAVTGDGLDELIRRAYHMLHGIVKVVDDW